MHGIAPLIGIIADWNDNHMWGGGGWGWFAMTLMMVFGAVMIGLVVWVLARGGQARRPDGIENARAILAERLARGEVTPDEYRERLQHLQ